MNLNSIVAHELAIKVAVEMLEKQVQRNEILDYEKSANLFTGAYMNAFEILNGEEFNCSKSHRR